MNLLLLLLPHLKALKDGEDTFGWQVHGRIFRVFIHCQITNVLLHKAADWLNIHWSRCIENVIKHKYK